MINQIFQARYVTSMPPKRIVMPNTMPKQQGNTEYLLLSGCVVCLFVLTNIILFMGVIGVHDVFL